MSKWIDADLMDRQIMIRRVSDEKHFADSAAEKDWWVTLCLKYAQQVLNGFKHGQCK